MVRVLAPAALLAAAGATAAVVLVNPGSPCNDIDYAAVRTATEGQQQAARRIAGCDALDGQPRERVHALLGRPAGGDANVDRWPLRSYGRPASLWAGYDAAGRVTRTELSGSREPYD